MTAQQLTGAPVKLSELATHVVVIVDFPCMQGERYALRDADGWYVLCSEHKDSDGKRSGERHRLTATSDTDDTVPNITWPTGATPL